MKIQIQKPLLYTLVPGLLLTAAMIPGLVNAKAKTNLATADLQATTKLTATGSGKLTTAAKMQSTTTNADKEISRRLTALNNLLTRITNMQNVTADQKSSFTTQVQAAIDQLTTLKTKIDSDTDAVTLKTDKQSIVSNYRVFALLLPQVQFTAHADIVMQLAKQMTSDNATIQAKIAAEKAAGKDVAALNTLMADRTSKLTDAATAAGNAQAELAPLTAAGYPGNKAILTSAHNVLQNARQDLTDAYQDLVKIDKAVAAMK